MKYKRRKQSRKKLQLYRIQFNFFPPYKVLIDGNFIQLALESKIHIVDQLTGVMQDKAVPMVTKCILRELEKLGKQMSGALKIAHGYKIVPCRHKRFLKINFTELAPIQNDEKPTEIAPTFEYDDAITISPDKCILSVIGEENKDKYCVASQDQGLRDKLRNIPGIPLLFISYNAINIESLSKETSNFLKNRDRKKKWSLQKKKKRN